VTIPGGVPSDVLREWQSAEERLYPVVMVRPDLYERSVQLVRAVADELATCPDLAALMVAWAEAAGSVYRAATDAGLDLSGLDAGLVAGAAFSLRYRELAWPAAREERAGRVREAAARGEEWVRVEESGSMETAGMVPWSWVEMHVPTGAGLRQTIEADPKTGAPRYRLERVTCDPVTGAALGEQAELAVEESFDDRAEWTAAVKARKKEIAGS
jgi:hypothetical protein